MLVLLRSRMIFSVLVSLFIGLPFSLSWAFQENKEYEVSDIFRGPDDFYVKGQLVVDQGAVVGQTLRAVRNATVGGTLGVTGNTTLGNATVGGALNVTGETTLSNIGLTGDITLDDATIGGNATVGGTLGVAGNTTLAGAIITGNATVGGTLGVTGKTTLSDELDVTGKTTLRDDLDLLRTATIGTAHVFGQKNNVTLPDSTTVGASVVSLKFSQAGWGALVNITYVSNWGGLKGVSWGEYLLFDATSTTSDEGSRRSDGSRSFRVNSKLVRNPNQEVSLVLTATSDNEGSPTGKLFYEVIGDYITSVT